MVQVLGAPAGFFSRLVPVVVDQLKSVFPELADKQAAVVTVLAQEERDFNRTLDRGIKEFNKASPHCSRQSSPHPYAIGSLSRLCHPSGLG